MLWPAEHLHEAYHNIRDQSLGGGCSVLVFVALDCDSLCACRILTNLFKSDHIPYKIKPVSGYGDIETDYNALVAGNEEIKSVVMINCGGAINLRDTYPLSESTYCYVIDSHRPYSHVNILPTSQQVIVFGDELMAIKPSDIPDEQDVDLYDTEESSSEDDDGSDSDDDDNDSRKSEYEDDEFDAHMDEDTENNANANNAATTPRVNRKEQKKLEKLQRKQQRQENKSLRKLRWQNYYRGTFVGQPASFTVYNLALQLNKECISSLWLSIVGTTYHFLIEQLPHDHYHQMIDLYREQANKFCPEGPAAAMMVTDDGVSVPTSEANRVEFSEEYRLMLYRHWSLYDAFYYSNYIASRLGTWRADGRPKLETFFAKMGISLKECKQKFSFMSVHLKQRLRQKIEKHAADFNLEDFTYGSFQYQAGFNTQLNAADVVYSVTALLEADERMKTDGNIVSFDESKPATTAGNPNTTAPPSNDPASADAMEEETISKNRAMRDIWEANFNTAFDSLLSRRNVELTGRGLRLSMELQRAVVSQGISIMEARLIQSAGDFRYLVLERLSEYFEAVFKKPHGLLKLALFLMQAYRDSGKWTGAAAKPFVLGVVDSSKSTALICGLQCNEDGEVKRNEFGAQFRDAAASINAHFNHDGFESSFIEIEAEEVQRFLLALNESVSKSVVA